MWDIQQFEEGIFQILDSTFQRTNAEKKKLMVWGKSSETDISIFYDERQLVDFTVRLDLRSLRKETLELICQVGKGLDGGLVTELGSVIEPNSKILVSEIKKSKSFKFISDPRGFFDTNESAE